MRRLLIMACLLSLSVSPVWFPLLVPPEASALVTQSQKQKLKKGMTKAQVKKALGRAEYEATNLLVYPDKGVDKFGVRFRNGKVFSWGKMDG